MSNWMNEAGEPYMTAAELRFEADLDEQSAYERQYDDFYDNDGEAPCEIDPDVCEGGDLNWSSDTTGVCMYCDREWPIDWNS